MNLSKREIDHIRKLFNLPDSVRDYKINAVYKGTLAAAGVRATFAMQDFTSAWAAMGARLARLAGLNK